MSNSTDTSCPRWRSSAPSRWVRLLKAWVSSRMRIDAALANAWQLVAGQPIDNAPAAKGGGELDKMMVVGHHFANHGGIHAQRMCAQGGQQARRIDSCANHNQLAFVGHIERVQAE